MNKKTKIIIGIIVFLIVAGGAFATYYFTRDRREYLVVLNGEPEIVIEVYSEYIDEGALVTIDGEKSELTEIKINSNLDTKKLGEYEIEYVMVEKDQVSAKRIVKVVDTTNPEITLNQGTISILENEVYEEPGFEVTDNYDMDLKDKVIVTGEIDTTTEGQYFLEYTVEDSSGNSTSAQREVNVKKPLVVVHAPVIEEKEEPVLPPVAENGVLNQITLVEYTNDGIRLEGSNEVDISTIQLVNKADLQIHEFPASVSNGKYSSRINLADISNGTYYIKGKEIDEILIYKLDTLLRLGRGRIGSKLVTFSYPNETMEITVEDSYYIYDIAINVGHGGAQPGAVNQYIQEKEMNLIVSLYEKRRYEEHGLSVYISRTADNYGELMGDERWMELTRSAYAFGYYASVSKIGYSNHHNSSASSLSGWEIIVPASATRNSLVIEHQIGSSFNTIFPNLSSRNRIYTRDYETGYNSDKTGGQVYGFRTYYAVIRIPGEIFNTQTILYEPMYMSSPNEFKWYWNEENWKKVSEIKIKHYVESIGVGYIEP